MRNIQSKSDFLLIKEQQINEGLFGFLKGIFKSIGKLYDKVKGGKELKLKIEEYKTKIDKIFQDLTGAEQTKTAANNNAEATIESALYEEVETDADATSTVNAQSGEETKNDSQNLNSSQLKEKIKVSKDHLKQLKINFSAEVETLKKKFVGKDGKTPKKLDLSLSLAKNQIVDHIYEKWEEHFTKIGDKKTISGIQKQRAEIAKEMKTNTESLQQMMEGGDEEQRTFEVGKKYKYTNSNDKEVTITIKQVEDDDKSVVSAELKKGDGETVTINPYTDKIGDKIEEEEQATAQPAAQADAQTQTQKEVQPVKVNAQAPAQGK